ncbi:endospore germination permease [Paenibacillus sp. CN-4]|uniref:GerAB/ArcD/ProY family transporter n=1 Tax=Paenibacillus nanchangensis TaxID=3348343 RepID=UPI0039786AFE
MNSKPITPLLAGAVVCNSIIGVGILSFPRYMADAGGSGAPLVTTIAVIAAYLSMLPVLLLIRMFPDENLFQFSRKLIGWPAADFFTLLVVLFFVALTGQTARQFGEVALIVLFRQTPIEAVILSLLLLCLFSTRRGIVKFSYIHYFYLPFIIGLSLIIILVTLQEVEWQNLLPLTGNGKPGLHTAGQMILGSLHTTAFFQSSFVAVLLVPYMRHPGRILGAGSWGVLLAGLIYVLISANTIGLFGAEETKLLFYPTLESVRSVSIGVSLLERFDALFIIIWVASVFTTAYSTFYLAAYAFRELGRFRDHRLTGSALLPLIFIAAMLPPNIFEAYTWSHSLMAAGVVLLTLYPLVLLIAAMLKQRRNPS